MHSYQDYYRLIQNFYQKEKGFEPKRPKSDKRKAIAIYAEEWKTEGELRDLYDRLAPLYFRFLFKPAIHGAVLAKVCTELQDTNPHSEILDLGCGIGLDTCFLATHFPNSQFIATDISEKMLKIAQDRAVRLGLNNISFLRSSHRELSSFLRGDSFNVAISNGSFFWFDRQNLRDNISVVSALLKNNGIFILVITGNINLDAALQEKFNILNYSYPGGNPPPFYMITCQKKGG